MKTSKIKNFSLIPTSWYYLPKIPITAVIVIAFSPWFILSAVLYALRGFNAGIGAPNRTAVNVRGISEEDYGAATSLQGVSTRLSQLTIGASGYFMDVWLPLPEILGGGL